VITHYLIEHFSYWILFVWSLFEGEIGLTLGGYLSKESDLIFSKVIIIAIIGAFISDITVFLVGKYSNAKVEKWLGNYKNRLQLIKIWFKKNVIWLILFERFIYGTHIPSLLFIGMSGYSFWKFLIFDIIGIIMWAITFTTLGYYFGESVIDVIMLLQQHLSIVFIMLFLGLIIFIQNKVKN